MIFGRLLQVVHGYPRFHNMTQDDLTLMREIIISVIKETVNGKIDTLRQEVTARGEQRNEDMKRIMPIILAYENGERRIDDAKASGKVVLWLAGFVTATGGAYLIVRQIFFRV